MPIKIAFAGTHGTGKTTLMLELAFHLKKNGYNVHLVSETARECPLPINEESTVESQLWIFGEMLKREQEAVKYSKDFILCDRTLLDTLAYTKRVAPETAKTLDPFVRRYMSTYGLIVVLIPKNKDYLKDDGIRSTNKPFQKYIDFQIKDYLAEFEVEFQPYTSIGNLIDKAIKLKEEK